MTSGISSNQMIRLIEEKLQCGFCWTDLKTGKMGFTEGFYRSHGVPQGLPMAFPDLLALIHPEDRAKTSDMGALNRSGQGFEKEFRMIRPDGRIRWMKVINEVVLNGTGEVVRSFAFSMDTTEQNQLRISLAQTTERYFVLLNAIATWIWSGRAGQPQDCDAWTALTGQAAAECYGEGWIEMLHESDRDWVRLSYRYAIHHSTKYDLRFRLLKPNGTCSPYRMIGIPISVPGGEVHEWVGMLIEGDQLTSSKIETEHSLMTGDLVRGARGLLNWSVAELSAASKLSTSTLKRIEDGTLASRAQTIENIRLALGSGLDQHQKAMTAARATAEA